MITPSQPSRAVRDQDAPAHRPLAFLLAFVIGLGIALILQDVDARSEHARWEATFAPCQTPSC